MIQTSWSVQVTTMPDGMSMRKPVPLSWESGSSKFRVPIATIPRWLSLIAFSAISGVRVATERLRAEAVRDVCAGTNGMGVSCVVSDSSWA